MAKLHGGKLVTNIYDKKYYEQKYASSLKKSKGDRTERDLFAATNLRTGSYSLRTQIKKNKWVSQGRPSVHAIRWLYKEVFTKSKIYKYNKALFESGQLYIFSYLNPKYKNDVSVLPWFDRYPLVVGLGSKATNLGVRNLGFNLHLLPPPIRIIVLCSIFEMYKRIYRYHLYYGFTKAIPIDYFKVVNNLKKYGILFCVRMYIPQRMRQKVCFPIKDWKNAIFIPSRGYERIKAKQLIKEWQTFCKKNGISISPTIDWASII